MGKDRIKTETTAEQYVAEVIGPKIEAIEEYLDSLKDNQTVVLNAIKEDNASLASKFEEMRTTKAQGRKFIFCNKENVDASIKESINTLLDDNLVQRKIKVETSVTAHISEADVKMMKDQVTAFREWMNSNKARQSASTPLSFFAPEAFSSKTFTTSNPDAAAYFFRTATWRAVSCLSPVLETRA